MQLIITALQGPQPSSEESTLRASQSQTSFQVSRRKVARVTLIQDHHIYSDFVPWEVRGLEIVHSHRRGQANALRVTSAVYGHNMSYAAPFGSSS
jgi:hypothetical protein